MGKSLPPLLLLLAALGLCEAKTKVGDLRDLQNHDVGGAVYVVDDTTILIEDFRYDGTVSEFRGF